MYIAKATAAKGSLRSRVRIRERTPQSSIEIESNGVHRRRRLHRGRKRLHDPLRIAPDTSRAASVSSTSTAITNRRWPIQCFLQRRVVGSHEVITIELPAFNLSSPQAVDATLHCHDVTAPTPVTATTCSKRRQARFLYTKEDLLIELKEQRDPKLSWKQIQRHFPNRTTASLQVHYCMRLKSRRIWKRRTVRD